VTGSELALSAWETDRSGPVTPLTWTSDAPPVTVSDRVIPRLMARQWPIPGHADAAWAAGRLCSADRPASRRLALPSRLGGFPPRLLATLQHGVELANQPSNELLFRACEQSALRYVGERYAQGRCQRCAFLSVNPTGTRRTPASRCTAAASSNRALSCGGPPRLESALPSGGLSSLPAVQCWRIDD